WRPPPYPGLGLGVELGGGDPGCVVDVVRICEALPGDGGPAEDPPPGFLQVQPAGTDRDEGVADARMPGEPVAGGVAVVAGQVIGDHDDIAGSGGWGLGLCEGLLGADAVSGLDGAWGRGARAD